MNEVKFPAGTAGAKLRITRTVEKTINGIAFVQAYGADDKFIDMWPAEQFQALMLEKRATIEPKVDAQFVDLFKVDDDQDGGQDIPGIIVMKRLDGDIET